MTMMMTMKRLSPVVFSALVVLNTCVVPPVAAEFGDAVDTSFTCPVRVTCPVICVSDLDDCPESSTCGNGTTLCPDGSCSATGCARRHQRRNPCPDPHPEFRSCGSKACPKTEMFEEDCYGSFADPYYQDMELCREEIDTAKRDFNARPLSLLGIWLFGLTAAVFFWCRCGNYHVNACQPLDDADGNGNGNNATTEKTQTGYTTPLLGTLLYYAVILTLVGFQALLLAFTWASYHDNEEESLRAFEVTWVIGFLWTFLFKYPTSIRAVFYRRCDLAVATIICVSVTKKTNGGAAKVVEEPLDVNRKRHDRGAAVIALAVIRSVSAFFSALLGSFFHLPGKGGARLHYLPVEYYRHRTGNPQRYFVYSFRRYNFDERDSRYAPGYLQVANKVADLQKHMAMGLPQEQVVERLERIGPNVIDMKKPVLSTCIAQEFSKPFYTYQNFILWTWMPLYYFYLALVHGSVILVGGVTVALFRYRNESNLYKLTHQEGQVNVLRDGQYVPVEHADVVPGDIVQVSPGKLYTDMVLIRSEGLLVDESALTGESTPMPKTALDMASEDPEGEYDPLLKHRKHVLSAGTSVMESELQNNLAVVMATGSYTSKGQLLRDVFSYERHSFQFDREVGIVFLILVIECVLAFILVWNLIDEQPVYAWFYGMYVVSTLLPPLLPTVFTVSVGISEDRLSKANIACSNSEDILVAGKVTKAIFDKTGTLTRQGLDFVSARCRSSWENLSTEIDQDVRLGMTCCHNLTRSHGTGELIGNLVDKTMFSASGGEFADRSSSSNKRYMKDAKGRLLSIEKQFDFDHHRMTQSVICKLPDGSFVAFVKGSGENVGQLCTSESLPSDFASCIRDSAKSGTYQITIAKKVLPPDTDVKKITRDELETGLTFIGVMNFKNVLREETPATIAHLENGEIQCIMATGDSLLTGITIAREAGMIKPGVKVLFCTDVPGPDEDLKWIDESTETHTTLPPVEQLASGAAGVELAVSGAVWEELVRRDMAVAVQMAEAIRVYGRCTPYHKVSVVSTFVNMGFICMMCGDGGNDCGALKTAHVGVALSDAEASIVSPFTSIDKSIESVVHIIREGRCALASAFASYKYIIMYGQIEAFDNVCNAYFLINFSEYCWVFMDGIWMLTMSLTLPLAQAAERLSPSRPTASLLGPITLSSVCGVLFLNLAFAITSLIVLFHQDWFQCRQWANEDASNLSVIGDNYEAETLFLITGLQYITSAMAFNFGYEFRQDWRKNKWFILAGAVFVSLHLYITLVPGYLSCVFRVNCDNDHVLYSVANQATLPIQNAFATTVMPMSYRWKLIVIMAVNTACIIAWDYYVVNGTRQRLGKRKRDESAQFVVKSDLSLHEQDGEALT